MVELLKTELGRTLTGGYLHGSLAFGSYFRPKSNIDVLAIIEHSLPAAQRRSLARSLAMPNRD